MNPEQVGNVIEMLIKDLSPGQKFEVLGRLAASIALPNCIVERATVVPAPQTTTAPAVPQSGRVMIPKGFVCECDSCNRPIYTIDMDVLENMSKKTFVAAFRPMGSDVPELKMPLDTWADASGNLAIDCPACKGTKSLWIKGKGDIPYNDVPAGSSDGTGN